MPVTVPTYDELNGALGALDLLSRQVEALSDRVAALEDHTDPLPSLSYPGEPSARPLWGAAVGGNSDPSAHEDAAGVPLGVRRTFFQWRHRNLYLPNVVEGDIAFGRLPWVSIKTPPWDDMARGVHDGEIDELLSGLAAMPGPVWLTVHHEPEGGGGVNRPDDPAGPEGHVAMNRRVRERMDDLEVDNVALLPVLMSWTWNPASGRDPDDWWEPGVYDLLGVDHYDDTGDGLVNDTWRDIRRWAADRSVDVAVGEWGTRGGAAEVEHWWSAAVVSWIDSHGAPVVALSAFDSGLNAPSGSWELSGDVLDVWREILAESRQ